jgi:hypothetical protein
MTKVQIELVNNKSNLLNQLKEIKQKILTTQDPVELERLNTDAESYVKQLEEIQKILSELLDESQQGLVKAENLGERAKNLRQAIDKKLADLIENLSLAEGDPEELRTRLSYLAFNMTDAEQTEAINKELAATWLFHIREQNTAQEQQATTEEKLKAAELWLLAVESKLIIETENEVAFSHKEIQNYFCFRYWLEQNDELSTISPENQPTRRIA